MQISLNPSSPNSFFNPLPTAQIRLGKSLLTGTLWVVGSPQENFRWLQFKPSSSGKTLLPLSTFITHLEMAAHSLKTYFFKEGNATVFETKDLTIEEEKPESPKNITGENSGFSLQCFLYPILQGIHEKPVPSLITEPNLETTMKTRLFSAPVHFFHQAQETFLNLSSKERRPLYITGFLLVLLFGFLLTT